MCARIDAEGDGGGECGGGHRIMGEHGRLGIIRGARGHRHEGVTLLHFAALSKTMSPGAIENGRGGQDREGAGPGAWGESRIEDAGRIPRFPDAR